MSNETKASKITISQVEAGLQRYHEKNPGSNCGLTPSAIYSIAAEIDANRGIDVAYDLAGKLQQARDRFVGTLMMLVHDGIISDGRARELIEMDIHAWRTECLRVMNRCEEPAL